jgi:hypothetical protein
MAAASDTTSDGIADRGHDAGASRKPAWTRGFFMLLFLIAFSLAHTLLVLMTVFQFGSLLIVGHANEQLSGFGRSLSVWLAQTTTYLTCTSERRPFPFAPWPSVPEDNSQYPVA